MDAWILRLFSLFICVVPIWGAFVFTRPPLSGDGLPYFCGERSNEFDARMSDGVKSEKGDKIEKFSKFSQKRYRILKNVYLCNRCLAMARNAFDGSR